MTKNGSPRVAKRRQAAMRLYERGLTVAEIAKRMGTSVSTANMDVWLMKGGKPGGAAGRLRVRCEHCNRLTTVPQRPLQMAMAAEREEQPWKRDSGDT